MKLFILTAIITAADGLMPYYFNNSNSFREKLLEILKDSDKLEEFRLKLLKVQKAAVDLEHSDLGDR